MIKITCFGEVLWDVFPTHKKIGGAPLNVAIRLQTFNNNISIISGIGNDEWGKQLLSHIKKYHIDIDNIQIDKQLKTGNVTVLLDKKGTASYDIKHPRAWDNIKFTDSSKKTTQESNAFVYGSLATRDSTTRNTLYELLKYANYKIFDVNLRPPFYTKKILLHLMNNADLIKFNDDELMEISRTLGSTLGTLEQNIAYIAQKTDTSCICVTKGKHGAILLHENLMYYNSGYQIQVLDTVGAGDSFLAALISQLLHKKRPQDALDFACAVGALVACCSGANPEVQEESINALIAKNIKY